MQRDFVVVAHKTGKTSSRVYVDFKAVNSEPVSDGAICLELLNETAQKYPVNSRVSMTIEALKED